MIGDRPMCAIDLNVACKHNFQAKKSQGFVNIM